MRYTGPKDKLSRREGFDLFGKGAKLTRLTVTPGVHGPKGTHGTPSQYGRQLREKQKRDLKHYLLPLNLGVSQLFPRVLKTG
jgi:small subunit ribosomal protein S4